MSERADDRGITDADRERMAAYAESGWPSALLGDEEHVNTRDRSQDVGGELTATLADHLRERLSVGAVLVAQSHEFRLDRSPGTIARSLSVLANNDPVGLDVARAGKENNYIRWRIERTAGNEARGGER